MNDELTSRQLDLLRSYASGPRIWDATSILPGVWELARLRLIESHGTHGAYQLTEAGRAALAETERSHESRADRN